MHRYENAYAVAGAVIRFGNFLKTLGLGIGFAMAIAGLVAVVPLGTPFGWIALIAAVGAGVVTACTIVAVGVIVSALGETLSASLDTAVNTSPLLTLDEKREVLGAGPSQATGAAPTLSREEMLSKTDAAAASEALSRAYRTWLSTRSDPDLARFLEALRGSHSLIATMGLSAEDLRAQFSEAAGYHGFEDALTWLKV